MKLRFVLAFSLLLLGIFATGAAAEIKANSFTLSPMIGGHVFEGNQDLEDEWTYGLWLGYNYTENWGTELLFNYTESSISPLPGDPDLDVYTYLLNGIYHLLPNRPIVPYLTLGFGGQTREPESGSSETDFLLNYGAGVKWFVYKSIALRGDVRHLIAFDQGLDEWSRAHDNLLYSAGLTFQFGAPAPAPEPAPAAAEVKPPAPKPAPAPVPAPAAPRDSDQDGVPDDQDQCPDTPRGVMVDEKGCPISLSIHIEFDFDKAEIKPEHRDELKKAADFIQEHKAPKILLAGHTDNIGTTSYNQELSQRRAAAVRQYLVDNFGIEADRLVARGYGESQPVASNETPEGRQQNRRTEVICCVFIPEE